MKIPTQTLLNELREITNGCISDVEDLLKEPLNVLQQKPSPESWSALESIEHLNRYGRFYLPEITNVLSQKTNRTAVFKSGVIGNYFAKSMRLKPKLNKMKTFKTMNPIHADLETDVLNEFLHQQETMLGLLDQAAQANLTKLKTKISISNYLKLRLGDTLRVVIYHNERHIDQAKRALNS